MWHAPSAGCCNSCSPWAKVHISPLTQHPLRKNLHSVPWLVMCSQASLDTLRHSCYRGTLEHRAWVIRRHWSWRASDHRSVRRRRNNLRNLPLLRHRHSHRQRVSRRGHICCSHFSHFSIFVGVGAVRSCTLRIRTDRVYRTGLVDLA